MKNRGIQVYKNIRRSSATRVPDKVDFKFSFDYGPKVEMFGNNPAASRTIKFKEKHHTDYAYSGSISPGVFTSLFRKWFTPWVAEAYDGDTLIWEFDFLSSLAGKKVIVSIDSSSLGDTLAWLPVIDKFRETHQVELIVTCFWNNLVPAFFPNLIFQYPGFRDPSAAAVFGVGWYEEEDRNIHKRDPRSVSLQQVAGDILGVDLSGDIVPPEIPNFVKNSERRIQEKYVCLATESTANAKHWHYPLGWETVIDFLKENGYEVVVIHNQNRTFENVIDKTGNLDITERAIDIYHSDFFIGIGSGLSWLAWALKKPVVMISGFSLPFCEFSSQNYRIINQNVCNGCFNDTRHKFDRGDWNWCPRLKNTARMFECSTKLTPDQVIGRINELMLKEGL